MNPSFLTEDRYRDAVSFLVNASVFFIFFTFTCNKIWAFASDGTYAGGNASGYTFEAQ